MPKPNKREIIRRRSHSPGIHNPDKGGIISMSEVMREAMFSEEVPVENPPAPSMRLPSDDGGEFYNGWARERGDHVR